jgi:mono/diheme cytochrome c family protein
MAPLAALSTGRAFLVGVAVGVLVIAAVGAVLLGSRRKRTPPELDIPKAMQPGPPDPELENRLLVRHYMWGLVLVVILAIWVPVYWLNEPSTNKADAQASLTASINRGHLTTLPGTQLNPLGFNCQRCHGQNLHGGVNVFNGNLVQVPNLQTVCGGAKYGHPLIKSLQDVLMTISEGRTGTDMPSWSVRFAGAMDDQQINDLVNYILSIQKVPPKDNVCLKS